MKITDLISQWKEVRDVESGLLRRKTAGNAAGIVAIASAALQIVLVLKDHSYIDKIGQIFYSLVRFRFNELAAIGIDRNQWIGLGVLFLGAALYYTLRRTNLLLKESKEPFRYTFWIQPFTLVKDTPQGRCKLNGDDRFHLMHHDLAERLAQRIQRFSILEEPAESEADSDKAVWLGRQSSHIQVFGSVAVREENDGKWVLHVMPLIRMGSATSPATLAPSVKYPLDCPKRIVTVQSEKDGNTKTETVVLELTADEYNQMVERVYSRVATEVYAQIELDVRNKIELFPTAYMRAVALYYEAEDFARSNTIDAYDRAIALYRDSLRYFELMPARSLHRWLLYLPVLWRREVHFQHQYARVVTGFAKCLVYKNGMSTLIGRDSNPLYELPELLELVAENIKRLHQNLGRIDKLTGHSTSMQAQTDRTTSVHEEPDRIANREYLLADVNYPKDSWFNRRFGRAYTPRFEAQKKIQFELYIVRSLVQFFLGSRKRANDLLEAAQATAADRVAKDPLYLLARGLVEPVTAKSIPYLRQAVDNEPNFQMAQWFLAHECEKEFRIRDEIDPIRAQSVINEYLEVSRINFGNIAALAALGHLHWLIADPMAKRKFEEGREVKAIARQTFVGQLNYGLARIAAEEGEFDECRNRYTEAIAADPTLAAHVPTPNSRAYRSDYDDIGPEMLDRFRRYKEKVENSLKRRNSGTMADSNCPVLTPQVYFTEKTLGIVHGFVLNDYGNACLRYFHYHGDHEQLECAIGAYEHAIRVNPTDAVPWFNLQNAYGWAGEYVKAAECFTRARELAPTWSRVAIDAARDRVAKTTYEIKKEDDDSLRIESEKNDLENDISAVESELEQLTRSNGAPALSHQPPSLSPKTLSGTAAAAQLQGQAGADPQATKQMRKAELEKEKDRLQRQKANAEKELGAAKQRRQKLVKQFDECMKQALEELGKKSRLTALFDGTVKDPIDRVVAIPWRKVDLSDVETLITLAEVLAAAGVESREYLAASQQLAEHLLKMYFEDARVVGLLREVVPKRIQVIKDEIEEQLTAPRLSSRARRLLRIACDRSILELRNVLSKNAGDSRVRVIQGKAISKLTSLLQKTIEGPLTPRVARRQLKHLKQLSNDSGSRWKTIVNYWMQSDSRTFLALYWYVEQQPDQPMDEIRNQYFKGEEDVFETLLGHVYFRFYRYIDALDAYDRALSRNPAKASYHFNRAKALEALGLYDEALAAFHQAHRLDSKTVEYSQNLARACDGVGNQYFEAGNYSDAIDSFQHAIALRNDSHIYYSHLSRAWEHNQGVIENVALQKAIEAMESAKQLAPDETEYQNELKRLATRQTLIEVYGERAMAKRPPDVARVGIDVAKDLSNLIFEKDSTELIPSVREKVNKMRENIKEVFGVETPIPFWQLDATGVLPRGAYRISIDGAPHEPSTVPADHKDAVDVIVRDLRNRLQADLATFVGHSEVFLLLKQSENSEVAALAHSPMAVRDLTLVLQGLLAEQVPILAIDAICESYRNSFRNGVGPSIGEMIEELRVHESIKPSLPGNSKSCVRLPIGPNFEKMLIDALVETDSTAVLALEPETCQQAISTILPAVPSSSDSALVVNDYKLRNPLRKLIELDFPNLHVVSRRELKDFSPDHSKEIEINTAQRTQAQGA